MNAGRDPEPGFAPVAAAADKTTRPVTPTERLLAELVEQTTATVAALGSIRADLAAIRHHLDQAGTVPQTSV